MLSDTELTTDALNEDVAQNSKGAENLDNLNNFEDPCDLYSNNEKIFLNSNAPDTLLTNLINGSYNSDLLKDNNKQVRKEGSNDLNDLAVARVEFNRLNSM